MFWFWMVGMTNRTSLTIQNRNTFGFWATIGACLPWKVNIWIPKTGKPDSSIIPMFPFYKTFLIFLLIGGQMRRVRCYKWRLITWPGKFLQWLKPECHSFHTGLGQTGEICPTSDTGTGCGLSPGPSTCNRADAKSTPSYSSDLHFSGFQYRPDRGALICYKICLKKLKNEYKGQQCLNFLYFLTNLGPIS